MPLERFMVLTSITETSFVVDDKTAYFTTDKTVLRDKDGKILVTGKNLTSKLVEGDQVEVKATGTDADEVKIVKTKDVVDDEKALKAAEAAVTKAETSQKLADKESAKTLVNGLKAGDDKTALLKRLDAITTIKVSTSTELNAALKDGDIKTIVFAGSFAANVVIEREVTIDGANKTLSGYIEIQTEGKNVEIKDLTVNAANAGKYGIQFHDVKGGILENVTVTNSSKGGILVNGSEVKVSNITLENNAWGGIEVSQGVDVTSIPKLTVTGEISHDSDTTPAVWIDGLEENDGWVVGGNFIEEIELPEGKTNQVWFQAK